MEDGKYDQIPSSYPAISKQSNSSNDCEIHPESVKDSCCKDAKGDDQSVHQLVSARSKNSSQPALRLEGANEKGKRYRRGKGLEDLKTRALPPDANAYDMTGIFFKRRKGNFDSSGGNSAILRCTEKASVTLEQDLQNQWMRGVDLGEKEGQTDRRHVQEST